MLRRIGDISGEGGPLLLADARQIAGWSGAEGEDYARACALFDDRCPEPPGAELLVMGRPAIVWEMGGAGSAEVFAAEDGGLLIVRAWVDDPGDIARLAALRVADAVTIGDIAPLDALVILWAAEDGRAITACPRFPGARPAGLGMEGTALVATTAAARYRSVHDAVSLASDASARRLHLTRRPDLGGPSPKQSGVP